MAFIPKISPHCRVENDGYYGTVRFLGEVPPTKGEWLGVEWDDPKRGKHDGSHQGHRYFQTQHAQSGSFLRIAKANFGVTFLEALEDRYGRIEDENAGVKQEEMFVVGRNQQTTHVEIVGAKKVNTEQSQFCALEELSFRNMYVNGETSGTDIGEIVPNVMLLDLSNNLIHSWQSLSVMTRTLRRLKVLNIGANRLELPSNPEKLVDAFRFIEDMYLNRMEYNWEEILHCCEMVPSLERLHLCFNNISTITGLNNNLTNLKLLNLEQNPIKDWKYVLVFGQLQHLEYLILNECQLDQIEFPDAQYYEKSKLFPKLEILHFKKNNLKEIHYINELNKLASLQKLVIMNNPVNEPSEGMSDETIYFVMAAKVASLTHLNRSQILAADRKGAEVDYMKKYGKEWKKAGGDQDATKNNPSDDFCRQHPRYQELVKKYGAPEDSELKEFSSALKNNLIAITMKCPNMEDRKVVSKKLPLTMTVQKLKQLVQRLFRADIGSMQLYYISQEMQDQEIELENDQKEIGYYSIEHGDTLLVKWDERLC